MQQNNYIDDEEVLRKKLTEIEEKFLQYADKDIINNVKNIDRVIECFPQLYYKYSRLADNYSSPIYNLIYNGIDFIRKYISIKKIEEYNNLSHYIHIRKEEKYKFLELFDIILSNFEKIGEDISLSIDSRIKITDLLFDDEFNKAVKEAYKINGEKFIEYSREEYIFEIEKILFINNNFLSSVQNLYNFVYQESNIGKVSSGVMNAKSNIGKVPSEEMKNKFNIFDIVNVLSDENKVKLNKSFLKFKNKQGYDVGIYNLKEKLYLEINSNYDHYKECKNFNGKYDENKILEKLPTVYFEQYQKIQKSFLINLYQNKSLNKTMDYESIKMKFIKDIFFTIFDKVAHEVKKYNQFLNKFEINELPSQSEKAEENNVKIDNLKNKLFKKIHSNYTHYDNYKFLISNHGCYKLSFYSCEKILKILPKEYFEEYKNIKKTSLDHLHSGETMITIKFFEDIYLQHLMNLQPNLKN